jgi:hypothetical protein
MPSIFFYYFFQLSVVLLVGIGPSLILFKNSFLRALLATPVIAFILISLLTANLSYLGFGMNKVALPLLLIMILFSLIITIRRFAQKKDADFNENIKIVVPIFCIAIFSSLIILLPVLVQKSWYFFNDNTTYIVHSEYLLDHGFFDKANVLKEQWTDNMYMYQERMARMGFQFYLSGITAASRAAHTLILYPSASAISQFIFISSLALLTLTLTGSIMTVFLTLFFAVISMGLNQGVVLQGFMPQAMALSLIMILITLVINIIKNKSSIELKIFMMLAFSSLLLTYQEIVPFYVFGVGLLLLTSLIRGETNIKKIINIALFHLFGALVFPTIGISFFYGLKAQIGSVVGWNQKTSILEYIITFLGQDAFFHTPVGLSLKSFILFGGLLASIWLIIISVFGLIKTKKIYLLVAFLLPFLVFLLYFRFFVINPFDGTMGQTWSIYKINQWTFWIYILLISSGLAYYINKNTPLKYLIFFLVLLLLPAFFVNLRIYSYHNANTLNSMIGSKALMEEYSALLKEPNKPANVFIANTHPYVGYLPIIFFKGESKGVFFPPYNALLNVKDINTFIPNDDSNFYQWIYYKNESVGTRPVIKKIAGFNIYSKGSSVAHFADGFSDREIKNGTHYSWLSNNGEVRILVPESSRNVRFKTTIEASRDGILKAKAPGLDYNQKLIFTKNDRVQKTLLGQRYSKEKQQPTSHFFS